MPNEAAQATTWVLNDAPPKFGAELAECQIYQLFVPGIMNWGIMGIAVANAPTRLLLHIPLPVSMRDKNPTIVVLKKGNLCLNGTVGTLYLSADEWSIGADRHSSSMLRCTITVTGHAFTPGDVVSVQSDGRANGVPTLLLIDNNL